MRAPDAPILDKVLQWLVYSDEDLRLAAHGFTLAPRCPYRLIAYHAQQCVEKHLKAYLVFHRLDFPYTHNIARLLDLCVPHASWGETLRIAEELTPFAVSARYPGEDEEVTEAEARRAVDIAGRVREVVRAALAQEGVEIPDEPPA